MSRTKKKKLNVIMIFVNSGNRPPEQDFEPVRQIILILV